MEATNDRLTHRLHRIRDGRLVHPRLVRLRRGGEFSRALLEVREVLGEALALRLLAAGEVLGLGVGHGGGPPSSKGLEHKPIGLRRSRAAATRRARSRGQLWATGTAWNARGSRRNAPSRVG